MLVLFETSAGFALFKVLDEGKLQKADDLWKSFESPESASKLVSLKKFARFKNTADALKSTTALVESKMSKELKKFLTKEVVNKKLTDSIALSDSKLGGVIKEKLGIQCTHSAAIDELLRGIRGNIESLIGEVSESDMNAMSLGLSHSLSRYKLKFSPDKVDTMIVQAISLLDDLDKELNTYAMRVREWYGWHFPELSKVIPDNILYAKAVKKMGVRTNAAKTDFSDFLPEEMEDELKRVVEISMGTEVSQEDIQNIMELCDQVISISEYREQLYEYLKNRMQAIAPNLSVLVGELVGARLIAHAGSLLNLAKHPASTVQILGAEKALFRALKTKHETPKYGLIYHASLIGQTAPKNKGKIARLLGAKAALAVRFDALGEGETNNQVGLDGRTKIEQRMKSLEGGQTHRISGTGKARGQEKYNNKRDSTGTPRSGGAYNGNSTDATSSMEVSTPVKEKTPAATPSKSEKEEKPKKKKKEESSSDEEEEEEKPKKKKKEEKTPSKKDKKKKSKKAESSDEESDSEEEKPKKKEKTPSKKDKKKRKKVESSDEDSSSSEEDKKKKKKKSK